MQPLATCLYMIGCEDENAKNIRHMKLSSSSSPLPCYVLGPPLALPPLVSTNQFRDSTVALFPFHQFRNNNLSLRFLREFLELLEEKAGVGEHFESCQSGILIR